MPEHPATREFPYCRVTSVYDGDTIRIDISLGFGVWLHNQSIRLLGIDTPEMRRGTLTVAKKARDFLRARIEGRIVAIQTVKNSRGVDTKGKYGRYLGTVWVTDMDGTRVNVNALMLEKGYAVPYGSEKIPKE